MTDNPPPSPVPTPAPLTHQTAAEAGLYAVQRAANGPAGRARPAGTAGKRPPPNLLAILQHGLRGRVRSAVLLGLTLGAAFAVAGWKFARPVYHSEALLRVAYSMPKVFQDTDQNEPMGQMFDTYMQSQKVLIGSRRVIDLAVKDPAWQTFGRPVPTNPDQYFIESLDVEIKPRSEFILVSINDADPVTAAAAATSIANGYSQLYRTQEQQQEKQRLDALESRRAFLHDRVEQLHARVREMARKYGTTALDTLHDAAMLRVSRFDAAWSDVRMALLGADASHARSANEGGDDLPATRPAAGPSAEQIALSDPVMRSYLTDRDALDAELKRLRAQGFGPSHKLVLATARQLDDARERVRHYAEVPQLSHGFGTRSADELAPVATAGKSVDTLRKDEAALHGMLDEAKSELAAIGIDRLALRDVEAEVAASQAELEDISKRTVALGGEAALGGRLTIVNGGEVPVLPDRDPRRKFAAAGLVAGFCLPAVLMSLLPWLRPRYRFHDEAEADMAARIPLLGILPALDANADHETEMTHRAAHSVHQLRVTLRAQSPRNGCCTYLITSASPGEGKTSLAMALALSFAASRLRTLVIDADLVGRQLTIGFNALEADGLHEALTAGTVRGLIRREPGGFDVLSAGRARSADACGLSPAAIDRLITEVRGLYDVVLIDSGPIMGSVEAAVFAPEVDSVIFAISRGQHADVVRQAQKRLDTLGARVAGVVFNRAQSKDFQRSPFGSSSASAVWQVEAKPAVLSLSPDFVRFGPLVKAVAGGIASVR